MKTDIVLLFFLVLHLWNALVTYILLVSCDWTLLMKVSLDMATQGSLDVMLKAINFSMLAIESYKE